MGDNKIIYTIDDIAERFDISTVTVRRQLAKMGVMDKQIRISMSGKLTRGFGESTYKKIESRLSKKYPNTITDYIEAFPSEHYMGKAGQVLALTRVGEPVAVYTSLKKAKTLITGFKQVELRRALDQEASLGVYRFEATPIAEAETKFKGSQLNKAVNIKELDKQVGRCKNSEPKHTKHQVPTPALVQEVAVPNLPFEVHTWIQEQFGMCKIYKGIDYKGNLDDEFVNNWLVPDGDSWYPTPYVESFVRDNLNLMRGLANTGYTYNPTIASEVRGIPINRPSQGKVVYFKTLAYDKEKQELTLIKPQLQDESYISRFHIEFTDEEIDMLTFLNDVK